MANKLTVQEHDTISYLKGKGWAIREIARVLKISRNTVRNHVRALPAAGPGAVADEIIKAAMPSFSGPGVQTDPLSTAGSGPGQNQTDSLATAGKNGRSSRCMIHAAVILAKVEANLTAQRIYQDLKLEASFAGSYSSVKRYVHQLRKTVRVVFIRRNCLVWF